jgi:hypothetical protein
MIISANNPQSLSQIVRHQRHAPKLVPFVWATGNEALVGMRLLAGHELRFAVVPGGVVEITPLP